jgi:hypothetical protein
MRAGSLLRLPLLLSCLGVTSCIQISRQPSSALNGNWHISGAPSSRGPLQIPLQQSPLLTFAIGVIGETVNASGSVGINCSNSSSLGGGTTLTGRVAADGTFQMSNAAQPVDTIQIAIQGKVPADRETTWTGSYTVTNAVPATGCSFNATGNFVASRYPPLNGTYSGMITGQGLGTGVKVTAQISQGVFTSANLPKSGRATYFTPLNSTMEVSGSATLTSGSTESEAASGESSIAGDGFILNYKMNDGSMLALSGWFGESSQSTLHVNLFNFNGIVGSGTLTLQ